MADPRSAKRQLPTPSTDAQGDAFHASVREMLDAGGATGEILALDGLLEDGTGARATWCQGRLVVDDALRRRAELVIALGVTFAGDGTEYRATLDGPLVAVALTLIRSFSSLTRCHLAIGRPDRPVRTDAHTGNGPCD